MIRFAELESLGLAVAAMSDRSDGDCRLPLESSAYLGREGRRTFLANLGVNPGNLVCVRQVHGVSVIVVGSDDRGKGGLDGATALDDCDAIATAEPGVPIGVSVADCVPLFVFDPVAGAVAVGHAGRMGTMENIASCIVEAMKSNFQTQPEDLHVLIGPSAGPERYEVSEEIAEAFGALDLPRRGRLLDLWGANRVQFARVGVQPDRITVCGHCTMGDARYYSHRGDGTGGRNLAVVSL